MSKNQDLFLDANIIPVVNVDSGTPITERPPTFSLSLEESFKNKIDIIDESDKSDKSILLETSHKVFEKLTGSLTSLSRTIKNSLDLGIGNSNEEGETELTGKSPVVYDIDVMGISPGNKFVATWSSTDGILAVFPIDGQHGLMSPKFGIKTPFDKTSVSENKTKIYLSVSEDGQYVSISKMTILEENQNESPNMEVAAANSSARILRSFEHVVYSTDNSTKQNNSKLNSMLTIGPLIFINEQRLICFTKNEIHLFSTKSWKLYDSIDISALIHYSPHYSEDSNEYLGNIYDILTESLRYGYLIWPEERSGLSVWDIDGKLRQWFYVEARNISNTRNLFAISPNGNLVAR